MRDGLFTARIAVSIYNRNACIFIKIIDQGKSCSAESMKRGAMDLWHCWMGHTKIAVVRDIMVAGKMAWILLARKADVWNLCRNEEYKNHVQRNLVEGSSATSVDVDVHGPMKHQNLRASKCFVLMIVAPCTYIVAGLIKYMTELQENCLN